MYIEVKYLNLLSPKLPLFKQKKRNLWNFRCPICGDSQKNKTKARGFIYEVKGELVYKCHNCGVSLSLANFIKELDPILYKEYQFEKFGKKKTTHQINKFKKIVSEQPVFKTDILKSFTPLDTLNNTHPAKEYILRRKLPTDALYYTEKFKELTNTIKPNTFTDTSYDEGRIIIPFRTKEGDVFGFQGRSLSNTGLRYITVLLDENQPKIFGLDKIDYEKTIYITEGPFDSLLLQNCVAMAGADAASITDISHNVVYVYDNEPRNEEITSRIRRHIDNNEKVVIWPQNISEKDINDMFLSGLPVQKLVECNVHQGLSAKLKFNEWKK